MYFIFIVFYFVLCILWACLKEEFIMWSLDFGNNRNGWCNKSKWCLKSSDNRQRKTGRDRIAWYIHNTLKFTQTNCLTLYSITFDLFNSIVMLFIWPCQLRCWSISIIRYLTYDVWWSLFRLSFSLSWQSKGFFVGIFCQELSILLALSKLVNFFKSLFKNLLNFLINLLVYNRFESYANWLTLQCLIAWLRSLMYERNS